MKKTITIGVSILSILLIVSGIGLIVGENVEEKNSLKKADKVITQYLAAIESGDTNAAYKMLANTSTDWLNITEFNKFIDVYTMEEKVSFEIDKKRKLEVQKIIEQKIENLNRYVKSNANAKDKKTLGLKNMLKTLKSKDMVYVPVKRSYIRVVAGKKVTVEDELVYAVVKGKDSRKIFFELNSFEDIRSSYLFGKAQVLTVESMESQNGSQQVNENIEKITKCINYAETLNEKYYLKNATDVKVKIFRAYIDLLRKNHNGAILKLKDAQKIAENKVDILKTKQVLSEVYISMGDYGSALEVLKEAMEVDPESEIMRISYRSVNRLMSDKIESSLTRGWNQLLSTIEKSTEKSKKEVERILKYMALPDADTVINVNSELPDGYYLKGSIYYCLGEFYNAQKELETALSKTSIEDISLKTEIAQTLGLAKVATKNTLDLSSYLKTNPGQIRSLLIREVNINGILDTM